MDVVWALRGLDGLLFIFRGKYGEDAGGAGIPL